MTIAGIDCKLYRNTGSSGSPTWVEMINVADVMVNYSTVEADTTDRSAGGWQTNDPVLKVNEITFRMPWIKDGGTRQANCAAVRAAFFGRSMIEIAAADGPIATAGTVFFRAEMKVFGYEEDQGNQAEAGHSVTMKPCRPTNLAPNTYTTGS